MANGHPKQHRSRSAGSTPSITSATRSHQQDINSRMARYALAMGIRTACFVLIFVLPSPWKWVAGAGALLLPYVAVLIANAGRERLPVAWGSGGNAAPVPSPHREEAPPAPPAAVDAVQVVRGETVLRGEAVRGDAVEPRARPVPPRRPTGDGTPVDRAS